MIMCISDLIKSINVNEYVIHQFFKKKLFLLEIPWHKCDKVSILEKITVVPRFFGSLINKMFMVGKKSFDSF